MHKDNQEDWTEAPYWIEALEQLYKIPPSNRTISINLQQLEETLYDDDGPAYQLLQAYASILNNEQERNHGYRGAPRVLLALLAKLSSQTT